MINRKAREAGNSAEPSPIPATPGSRLSRVRRNQRVLVQNIKQTLITQQNAVPPPRDPLAP